TSGGVTCVLPQPIGKHTPSAHAPMIGCLLRSTYMQNAALAAPAHCVSCSCTAHPSWPSHTMFGGQSTVGHEVIFGSTHAATITRITAARISPISPCYLDDG